MAVVDHSSPAGAGADSSKVPSSVLRVSVDAYSGSNATANASNNRPSSYEMPVVHDAVNYTDSLLKSNSLSAAAYRNAEALATTVYKRAGEPLQDKLQPQVSL